jgi:predicted TIM-barrel fold metal-dependent hydrolase
MNCLLASDEETEAYLLPGFPANYLPVKNDNKKTTAMGILRKVRAGMYPGLVLVLLVLPACMSSSKLEGGYYTLADFATVEKYDTHVHINTKDPSLIQQAAADHFRLLTINVEAPHYPPVAEQQDLSRGHVQAFPEHIAYATTFTVQNWESQDWQQQTLQYLKDSFTHGAIAVKIWKNIGMELKDSTGKFVMIDHPRIDPIFHFLEQNKVPVIGHLGEPKNCWMPLSEMTVKNNRDYYRQHPQYHMYLHPEAPSYEQHIWARDQVLARHPDLAFTGAHLGSLEWSVDALGQHLDKFPNLTVDMAARMAHFQDQALTDWQKVHDFFIKYQDRLLYATDIAVDTSQDPAAVKKRAHDTWLRDWKFLVTAELMQVPAVEGTFKGLHLPRGVIDKIYRKNAVRLFPGIAGVKSKPGINR